MTIGKEKMKKKNIPKLIIQGHGGRVQRHWA